MILSYTLKKSVEEIYICLADMQKFVEVHPVIYKAEKITEKEYLLYEKINLVFVPYKFNYKVSLNNFLPNQYLEMTSQVQKGVHLTLKFSLKSIDNRTEVIEEVVVVSNFIVKIIFKNILRKIHKKLFYTIENTIN